MPFIDQHQVEEMKKLRAEGCSFEEIGKKFDICTQTASNHVNGKTRLRYLKRRIGRPKIVSIPKRYAPADFSEQDFSQLPDHILFQHVRECNFIG